MTIKNKLLILLFDSPISTIYFIVQQCINKFVKRIYYNTGDKEIILDFGAGTCQYKELFNERNYITCDIIFNKKLDFIASYESIPIKTDSVDVVMSIQTIEHFSEPSLALSEFFRILKQGGKLFITTNMSTDYHLEPHDYYRFTKYGLKYLIEKNGFNIIEINPHGGRGALLFRELMRMIISGNNNYFMKIVLLIIFMIPLILIGPVLRIMEILLKDYNNVINYECVCEKPCDNK